MPRRLLILMISATLLFFFSVPIAFLLYGGAGAALGGFSVIGLLMLIQFPFLILAQKIGVLPQINRDVDPNEADAGVMKTIRQQD